MDNNEARAKLSMMDHFQFRCHSGLKCFTGCCADVNIYLGPYDVVRLKNRLGLTSSEFLQKYAYLLASQNQIIPLVILKMNDDQGKKCPFVTAEGCSVYEDRPWPCRMYPLDMDAEEKFSIIADPAKCLGLNEQSDMRVIEWVEDQGVMDYQRAHNYYSEILDNPKLGELDVTSDKIKQMILMATYDLDKFRDFIFESRFLTIFDLEDHFIEQIRVDDTELLRFGLDWIKFGLFAEKTLNIKPEVLEAAKKRGGLPGMTR